MSLPHLSACLPAVTLFVSLSLSLCVFQPHICLSAIFAILDLLYVLSLHSRSSGLIINLYYPLLTFCALLPYLVCPLGPLPLALTDTALGRFKAYYNFELQYKNNVHLLNRRSQFMPIRMYNVITREDLVAQAQGLFSKSYSGSWGRGG